MILMLDIGNNLGNAESTIDMLEDTSLNLGDGSEDLTTYNMPPVASSLLSKKGHKRAFSDVTQLRNTKSQTLPKGFAPPNNKNGTVRASSFFGGLANKLRNAFEGKVDGLQSKNSTLSVPQTRSLSNQSSPTFLRKSTDNDQYPSLNNNHLKNSEMNENSLNVSNGRHIHENLRKRSPLASPLFQRISIVSNSSGTCSDYASLPPSPEIRRASDTYRDMETPRPVDMRRNHSSPFATLQEIDSNDVTFVDAIKSGDVKLVVMGAEEVGKTALIVRYITKRFIGEYAPNIESVYDQTINIDGKEVGIHIWDSAIPPMLQKRCMSPESDQMNQSQQIQGKSLSITSLSSSVASSLSSTSSSARDSRISNSSVEEGDIPTLEYLKVQVVTGNHRRQIDSAGAKRKNQTRRFQGRGDSMLVNDANENEMQKRLSWCDGVVVVYSICDAESFEAARDIVRYVRGHYVRGHSVVDAAAGHRSNSVSSESSPVAEGDNPFIRIPILLVGNKSDLEHRRRVDIRSLHAFSAAYGCDATELSVSDGFEPVTRCFNSIVEMIRKEKAPNKLTRIKSIVRTVSGTFGHRRNMSM